MATLRDSLVVSGQTISFVETVTRFSGRKGEVPMYAVVVGSKTIPNFYVSGHLLDSDTTTLDARLRKAQTDMQRKLTQKSALLAGV